MHLKFSCDFSPETSNSSFYSRRPHYYLGPHLWKMLYPMVVPAFTFVFRLHVRVLHVMEIEAA